MTTRRGLAGVGGWAVALPLVLAGCSSAIPCGGNPGCPDGMVCDLAALQCVHAPDPCATANGGCDPRATCAWDANGRLCACPDAYQGDGLTCTADATRLASLAVTVGTLSLGPQDLGFDPQRRHYAVQAPAGADRLAVLPVVAWPGQATLRLQGEVVASGATATLPLPSLSVEVALEVRAVTGEVGVYTLTVLPPP